MREYVAAASAHAHLNHERLPMSHPKSPLAGASPGRENKPPASAMLFGTSDTTPDSSNMAAPELVRHKLFSIMEEVSASKDHEFGGRYADLVGEVERTFRAEEQWMEDLDFPDFRDHQEQHARVLGVLHHVHKHVMDGEFDQGRLVVAKLLPQWLEFHASMMDAPLARAMQTRQDEFQRTSQRPQARMPTV